MYKMISYILIRCVVSFLLLCPFGASQFYAMEVPEKYTSLFPSQTSEKLLYDYKKHCDLGKRILARGVGQNNINVENYRNIFLNMLTNLKCMKDWLHKQKYDSFIEIPCYRYIGWEEDEQRFNPNQATLEGIFYVASKDDEQKEKIYQSKKIQYSVHNLNVETLDFYLPRLLNYSTILSVQIKFLTSGVRIPHENLSFSEQMSDQEVIFTLLKFFVDKENLVKERQFELFPLFATCMEIDSFETNDRVESYAHVRLIQRPLSPVIEKVMQIRKVLSNNAVLARGICQFFDSYQMGIENTKKISGSVEEVIKFEEQLSVERDRELNDSFLKIQCEFKDIPKEDLFNYARMLKHKNEILTAMNSYFVDELLKHPLKRDGESQLHADMVSKKLPAAPVLRVVEEKKSVIVRAPGRPSYVFGKKTELKKKKEVERKKREEERQKAETSQLQETATVLSAPEILSKKERIAKERKERQEQQRQKKSQAPKSKNKKSAEVEDSKTFQNIANKQVEEQKKSVDGAPQYKILNDGTIGWYGSNTLPSESKTVLKAQTKLGHVAAPEIKMPLVSQKGQFKSNDKKKIGSFGNQLNKQSDVKVPGSFVMVQTTSEVSSKKETHPKEKIEHSKQENRRWIDVVTGELSPLSSQSEVKEKINTSDVAVVEEAAIVNKSVPENNELLISEERKENVSAVDKEMLPQELFSNSTMEVSQKNPLNANSQPFYPSFNSYFAPMGVDLYGKPIYPPMCFYNFYYPYPAPESIYPSAEGGGKDIHTNLENEIQQEPTVEINDDLTQSKDVEKEVSTWDQEIDELKRKLDRVEEEFKQFKSQFKQQSIGKNPRHSY